MRGGHNTVLLFLVTVEMTVVELETISVSVAGMSSQVK